MGECGDRCLPEMIPLLPGPILTMSHPVLGAHNSSTLPNNCRSSCYCRTILLTPVLIRAPPPGTCTLSMTDHEPHRFLSYREKPNWSEIGETGLLGLITFLPSSMVELWRFGENKFCLWLTCSMNGFPLWPHHSLACKFQHHRARIK